MTTAAVRPDVVAVAGSAGGVEALKRLVAELPEGLPATVLVALHVPATERSYLTDILARRCALPVRTASTGALLVPGEVVVARADAHLLVVDGRIALGCGPRENGARPSHDAMLRSVALDRGPRAIGVVLTGLLSDGAAGLATLARYGGRCFVQDPAEADFPSMPLSALRAVPTARALPVRALVEEVVSVVQESSAPQPQVASDQRQRDEAELASALGSPVDFAQDASFAAPSPFACPDCHGVLHRVADDAMVRFRCRTGHAWSADNLVAQMDDDLERALWTALRVLEERAQISGRLADAAGEEHREWSFEHFRRRAAEASDSAAMLRSLLHREAVLPAVAGAVAAPQP